MASGIASLDLWYALGDEQMEELYSDERNWEDINCMMEQVKYEYLAELGLL